MKRLFATLAALLLAGSAHADDTLTETRIAVHDPRPYGYQIGDTFQREVRVFPAPGVRVQDKALTKPGRAGTWFELRSIAVDRPDDGSVRLVLDYQVINVPTEVRTVSTPSFAVPVTDGQRLVRMPLQPAWVTVAPMTPQTVLGRDRLTETQADIPAKGIDTAPLTTRLRWLALAALLPILALVYCWTPWDALLPRPRPFAKAFRQAHRARNRDDQEFWSAALRALHAALDQTAGQTVFTHNVTLLAQRNAAWNRLLPALGEWLTVSRAVFFTDGAWPGRDQRARLLQTLNDARAIERGIH
jgi:mxaA protein